ncbi:MAG: N,N-dimethylformamidase [Kiritimatiellia bacterium]|jgi:N,N-dimethylformamidase
MRRGRVLSAARCEGIHGAQVDVLDAVGTVIESISTGDDGRFELQSEGTVRFRAEGFVEKVLAMDSPLDQIRLLENALIGYLDRFWWRPGDELPVYIHAPERFTITLCRHGKARERILELGSFDAMEQHVPDGWFVEEGLSWNPTTKVRIPETALPGLYSLLLESAAETYAISLVVSTPPEQRNRNRLLVLVSTNNWLSYNLYGGRSRYRNFEQEASRQYIPLNGLKNVIRALVPRSFYHALEKRYATQPWMLHRLSIKRPFPYSGLEASDPNTAFANHLAGGEWRVLAWLEAQGIPYDITSGCELHREPEQLSGYRALIMSTHCEYWSKEMYQGVKRWHETQGGWVLNLSGNSMYREIEYDEDGSHRCTSLYFEDSCADESELIGVRFSMADYGTCAPYRIEDAKHWAFEGLDVSAGTVFGERSLNGQYEGDRDAYVHSRPGLKGGLQGEGASGWETDKLTATASKAFHRIAKGQNARGGADMVVREPSGAQGGVFSASSITFGGALLIDKICSGIVRNVLDRCLGD